MFRRRWPTPGRCRAALLLGLILFVLGQVSLALYIEFRHPELSDPEYGFRLARLKRMLRHQPEKPLVVVLGSSRSGVGIRPAAVLEGAGLGDSKLAFNFSQTGAGPTLEMLCLQRLLAAGIRPQYILLEVLTPALNSEGPLAEEARILPNRWRWNDLRVGSAYVVQPAHTYSRLLQWQLVPGYSNRFFLMGHYAPDWQPEPATKEYHHWKHGIDSAGWQPVRPDQVQGDPAEILERTHREYEYLLKDFRVRRGPDRLLRDMLALCQKEGIQVALFCMPVADAFRGWYPAGALEQRDAYVEQLAQEYGVPWLDADDCMANADFADGNHLFADPADRFSRRFGRCLVRPFLDGRLRPGRLGMEPEN